MKNEEPKLGNAWFTPFRKDEIVPVDQIIDNLLNKAFPNLYKEVGVNWVGNEAYPRVDIINYPDRAVIEADVHGLTKEDVSVEITDNILTISGKKRESRDLKGGEYVKREIKRSTFKRSFELTEKFLTDQIEARFENGMLIVVLKKETPPEPKKPVAVKITVQ